MLVKGQVSRASICGEVPISILSSMHRRSVDTMYQRERKFGRVLPVSGLASTVQVLVQQAKYVQVQVQIKYRLSQ